MPGYVGGQNEMAGIKWIGSKHDNPSAAGIPRASAVIVLNDPETHFPIAIMEGGEISGMRTAGVSVLAAEYLARPGFRRSRWSAAASSDACTRSGCSSRSRRSSGSTSTTTTDAARRSRPAGRARAAIG